MTWKVYEAQQLGLPLEEPKNQLHLFDENVNSQLCQKMNQLNQEQEQRLFRTRQNLLFKGSGK